MLEPRLQPVSLLDGSRQPEPADGSPDPGCPNAAPSRRTLSKGDHQWCTRIQEAAQVSKKTNSAISPGDIHVSGKADQNSVVVSVTTRHGGGRYVLKLRVDALFPQFTLAGIDQRGTTIKA